jgi:regulatory protein
MSGESVPAIEQALGLAYAYLNRRDCTVAEMRAHLHKRGIQDRVAEAVVDELQGAGYLNDDRFARLFAQDKGHLEQWGNDRIRRALIGRGIPEHLVATALGAEAQADEHERALALLQRRFPDGLSGRKESERALGVLLRKGYEYELAVDVLSEHRRRTAEAA